MGSITNIRCKVDVPYVNTVADKHDSANQELKGKIYSKVPFKFLCEKGKTYFWCSCGESKTQVITIFAKYFQ